MSTHKYIDRICCAVLAAVLVLTLLFVNGEALGLQAAELVQGYEARLFDTSRVHTIDIVMDDWEGFLDTCENEEYQLCALAIDGESTGNAAIRAKGNTSLTSVAAYGNDRYSFKIEFDHYDSTNTYYGLDKLSLNNIIQDNTYMKDFLTYQLMARFGVAAPLCSYVFITVNGEDWGLYLAVEGVEDAFLRRNYGADAGMLYKPDSMSFGGGRGNGRDFDFAGFSPEGSGDGDRSGEKEPPELPETSASPPALSDAITSPQDGQMPGFSNPSASPGSAGPSGGQRGGPVGRNDGGGMGSSDVKLQYIDGDPSSYANIFDNAKTDVSDVDQARLIASLKALSSGQNIENVVDVEQVIRYFVVHGFVCNGDSYTGSMVHNYYLYEKDGVLSMIPWDYNLAFGGFQAGTNVSSVVNEPIDTPVSGGSVEDRPMLAWIFASDTYTALYHQYYAAFLEACLDSGWCTDLIDSTFQRIAPYVEKDPTKFCTYEEFTSGVSTLKDFCTLRAESIHGQLNGTIPSTTQGQAEDASALVDASSLVLSQMGGMKQGGGIGQPQDSVEAFQPMQPDSRGPGGQRTGGEEHPAPSGSFPDAPDSSGTPSHAGGGLIVLLVSAAALLAGLAMACFFPRRRRR